MSSLKYSKIVIPISETIRNNYIGYPQNESLFDENGNLRLYLFPEDYVPEFTYGSNEVTQGFTSYQIRNNNPEYAFNVTVQDARIAIKYILDELIATATNNPLSYQLIPVYDYHNVDFEDRNIGYSTRYCVISYELKGGTFRASETISGDYFHNGLSIKFTQLG
jgi:hypothetical protein